VSANVVPGNDSLKMSVTITNGSNRDAAYSSRRYEIRFPAVRLQAKYCCTARNERGYTGKRRLP
jgi:hypothetical protein